MKNDIFYSDMAVDNLENRGLKDIAVVKNLNFGIKQIVVNVKDNRLSERVGKPRGLYVTYDCSGASDENYALFLSKVMANTLHQMIGLLQEKSTILAVGLGNGQVLADSLGVEGVTGIKSQEVLTALNDGIKPSAIIVVDSLATTSVNRLGTSFQMSTAGIVPASGVGQDKPPMTKDVFGVPTISIGVPLVLTMQGVMKDFVRSYSANNNDFQVDEFSFHALLNDKKLSRLVVAPKEVKIFLDNTSNIISNAINLAYGF